MPWSAINVPDIEAHLNTGELSDYRKHVTSVTDPLPTIIRDVVAMVRGYIAGRYTLETEGVPDSLRAVTIDLIIHRLAKRLHRDGDGDMDRASAADRASKVLEDLARGAFALGEPTASTTYGKSGAWGGATKFDSPPV